MGAVVNTAERGSLFERAGKHILLPHVDTFDQTPDGEVIATVLYRGFVIMFQGPLLALEVSHTFSAKHATCPGYTIDFCAAMVRSAAGL
jgi:hypothetical protein